MLIVEAMAVHDAATDTVREAKVFFGAPGASHLIFAGLAWTQSLPDWIGSHVRMLDCFGGVTALIVPDNLNSGVASPCYYGPTVHATYQDFATHYGNATLPARIRHPRDKAKVETAVQIVEREILAPLRHDDFYSIAELAHVNASALERVYTRPAQKLTGSRRSMFWATECATAFVRLTAAMVEILHRCTRVVVHACSVLKGRFTIRLGQRSKAHDRHVEWRPSRLIAWGTSIGPATAQMVEGLLARYPHPEQRYHSCLGLFALKRRDNSSRLDAACWRACVAGTNSYRPVQSILATGVVSQPLDMATALDEQRGQPDLAALSCDERLAMLLYREQAVRCDRRLTRLLQLAGCLRLTGYDRPISRRSLSLTSTRNHFTAVHVMVAQLLKSQHDSLIFFISYFAPLCLDLTRN